MFISSSNLIPSPPFALINIFDIVTNPFSFFLNSIPTSEVVILLSTKENPFNSLSALIPFLFAVIRVFCISIFPIAFLIFIASSLSELTTKFLNKILSDQFFISIAILSLLSNSIVSIVKPSIASIFKIVLLFCTITELAALELFIRVKLFVFLISNSSVYVPSHIEIVSPAFASSIAS